MEFNLGCFFPVSISDSIWSPYTYANLTWLENINTNILFRFLFINFLGSCNYDSLCSVAKYFEISRSSHLQMFLKIGDLKNFAIFTGKHLCWSLNACNLIKKETSTQVFSCEYCEIFRYSFFYKRTSAVAAFGSQRIWLLNTWKLN